MKKITCANAQKQKAEIPPRVQSLVAAVLKMKHEIQCANAEKSNREFEKPKLK